MVLLPPSSKEPTDPPKMKYFHEGMEGAKIALKFHLGYS